MRILTFDVSGQSLKRVGDFGNLVAGSEGYLRAKFTFDGEHAGCKHIAVFIAKDKEYPVVLEGNECIIPAEALKLKLFKVYVVSLRKNYRIQTRKVVIRQDV